MLYFVIFCFYFDDFYFLYTMFGPQILNYVLSFKYRYVNKEIQRNKYMLMDILIRKKVYLKKMNNFVNF